MTDSSPTPPHSAEPGAVQPPARAVPRGRFPHSRRVGDVVYVSGTSSRRPDNSIAGAAVDHLGTTSLDIREQTGAVLDNIAAILADHGATLDQLVQATTYLVNMNDFGGYNEVWAQRFTDPARAPARTTVAVHQLPHPHLLIEIAAVAHLGEDSAHPSASRN